MISAASARSHAATLAVAAFSLAVGTSPAGAAPDHTARLTLAEPVFAWQGGPGTGVSEPVMVNTLAAVRLPATTATTSCSRLPGVVR